MLNMVSGSLKAISCSNKIMEEKYDIMQTLAQGKWIWVTMATDMKLEMDMEIYITRSVTPSRMNALSKATKGCDIILHDA